MLNEIGNMKYLLGYKRGVVISEQTTPVVAQDDDNNLDSKVISASIDSGDFANLNPVEADAIKQAQNALGGQSVLTNPAAGSTTPTTGAPAAATTPVTPIKIGVTYPRIEEL